MHLLRDDVGFDAIQEKVVKPLEGLKVASYYGCMVLRPPDEVAYDDPDYYTAQVYSMLLGGGMSSRLFQEVREKRGLCYSIFTFNSSFASLPTQWISTLQ